MNNSNLSDQASVIVVELERTAMMYWLHEHVLKKMDMMFLLTNCRSMSSDVEISVVWMVPRNSGDNWSTCSGHRETLLSRSRRIFSQLRVTSKVKRRLTLTFRNHKCTTTRKIQDDRLTNIARNGVSVGRCSSWCCSWSLHEPNHQICGNDVCSWGCYWTNKYMIIAHEAVVEKYVHDVIMNLRRSWVKSPPCFKMCT